MKTKVKVYKKQEPTNIYLTLKETTNGINLLTVDEHGNAVTNGAILLINETGLHIHSGMSDKIGIASDNNGCIKINYYN